MGGRALVTVTKLNELAALDRALTPEEKARVFRRSASPGGYAAKPGTGPDGEDCGTCRHIERIRYAKTYLKCGLMRHVWTGGPGTDIRAGSPACDKWEAKQ